MLKQPDLKNQRIIACLREAYGLSVDQVAFLPIGADSKAAVYRVVADDGTPYFLKLKKGLFDETSLALTKFLGDQDIRPIIAPLTTKAGQLWTTFDAWSAILYPFIEGQNGYEVMLSDHHWGEFGVALRSIHALELPSALARRIRPESYSPQWRDTVKMFLEHIDEHGSGDPVAKRTAAFLMSKHDEILFLVGRAEELALVLQARSPEFVLCHADIHAGNVLINNDDAFYIVDWDEAILAPKERDLMFIGGGLMGHWYSPQEEESLFFRAYGQTSIDLVGLAYYRYERIIEDIAVICEQIFSVTGGAEDREQSFRWLVSNFRPNHTIELAYRVDRTLRDG
ncbi:MAG: aminoglycoside phosphotransferase family protein [Anaerolineaceae bacterium]|nr:MAG: aminoglycoside phosphotransferase family protein [Anaerolineaceae bacterium]